MSDTFECMLIVSEMSEIYTADNPNVTFYPTAETVVAETETVQLLAKSEKAKEVIELCMGAKDLQIFLEDLASEGVGASNVYEGVVWRFEKFVLD